MYNMYVVYSVYTYRYIRANISTCTYNMYTLYIIPVFASFVISCAWPGACGQSRQTKERGAPRPAAAWV